MRRSTVFILFGLLVWIAGVFAVSYAAYQSVRRSGEIEIRVDDGYQRVHFALPAVVPSLVVDQAFHPKSWRPLGVHHEAEHWGPAVLVALQELEAYDYVPLVEVNDGRERVRIEKRGQSIVIEVTAPHESVRVTMPVRIVRGALERYES